MSELVAFYDEKRVEVKGKVEIQQLPLSSAAGMRCQDGGTRTGLVYVLVSSEPGPFLVPFGAYDEWSLRDRYNEAIRIMNTLGASEITCESFREIAARRGIKAKVFGKGGELTEQRLENSQFDFHHVGAGSEPRDPRPLRWADEPGFSAAVSSVLENKATVINIHIRSNRTHSIDGSLGGHLRGVGFDLGGGAQSSGATSLRIRATFPQTKKGFW